MRPSKASVSSTDEKSPRSRPAASCVQILAHDLLDNFWYQIQAIADRRRIFLYAITIIGLGDLVRAQALGCVKRVRHRHDIVGRRLTQLVDEIDNSRQLVDRFAKLIVGEAESSQRCDVLNLIFIE